MTGNAERSESKFGMWQALEHPYIAQFHDPQLETVADEIINIQLSDNVKVI